MALTKCKDCNTEMSSAAVQCPKCGRPNSQRSPLSNIWSAVKIVLTILVLAPIAMCAFIGTKVAKEVNSEATAPPKANTSEPDVQKLALDYNWTKGGFDSILMLSGSITNNGEISVKDIVIVCTDYSPSGTRIDSNKRTLYERIGAGKTLPFHDFNMGFLHSQVKTTACEIDSASPGY